jgi:hypothetical protein
VRPQNERTTHCGGACFCKSSRIVAIRHIYQCTRESTTCQCDPGANGNARIS